ncbi:MAG: class II aldolase/adducin family protein [Desulfobacteraceae bacterium]
MELIVDETHLRQEIVQICHLLHHKNMVAATDGNVSARLSDHRLLITPSGLNKGFIKESDILTVDLTGKVMAGEGRPSSEIQMHLTAYRLRPDIAAVVHAHPPRATACSIAGVSLEVDVLPEVIITLGAIPTADYATPGTMAVSQSIQELIRCYDALVLAHHGGLTVGRTLMEAYNRMEKLEHAASIMVTARQLGRLQPLPAAEVEKLTRVGVEQGFRPPEARNLLK